MSPIDIFKNKRNTEQTKSSLRLFVPNLKKKLAFTLAEVLITLGIIGVVAAITLPNLIGNYQEKATISKLKKVYSLILNSQALAENELGEIKTWVGGGYDYYTILTSNLKMVKNFENNSTRTFYRNGLTYRDRNGNSNVSLTWINFKSGVMNDGVYIGMYNLDNDWWSTLGEIVVDLNGDRKPNVLGRDVFSFAIGCPGKNWCTTNGAKGAIVPGGVSDGYLFHHGNLDDEKCLQGSGTCTNWIFKYGNMDYLKCANKMLEKGTHSCSE